MASRLPAGTAPARAETVPVGFAGAGAGTGELSWGQRNLWQVMEEKHTWLPIGAVQTLPAGTTVAAAVADLRFVMSGYPSMRTRLEFGPQGVRQVVAGTGEIDLEIVDAPDSADPAEVAREVERRYKRTGYDHAAEWPVRMAVVRHRGALTHRVWIMCHLVTDGGGADVILAGLAGRRSPGRPEGPGEPVWPPLAQAAWQCSAAGQRQCAMALRYWDRLLRDVPARRFPPRTEAPHPRYWQARFESLALRLATRVIAARVGVETATVLLSLYATALAKLTRITPVVVQVSVSNRFRPGLAGTVSPIMQNGLFAVDVPDTTVDEAVSRTRRRALTAYKYAYYDPARLAELLARVDRDRGEHVHLDCFYNDRRSRPEDPGTPVPTPEQVRRAGGQTSFRWQYRQDFQEFDTLFLTVEDVPERLAMTLVSDVHRIPPELVEACAQQMEEVAVAAALDPATRTGTGARRGG